MIIQLRKQSAGDTLEKESQADAQETFAAMGLKRCSRCKQFKPYSDFQKNKQAKDRHFSWCKLCHRKQDMHRGLDEVLYGDVPVVVSLDQLMELEGECL